MVKLNAEDFGVPQRSRRLFIVADREQEPSQVQFPRCKAVPVKRVLNFDTASSGYSYRRRPLFGAGRAQPTLERAERAIEALGPTKEFLIVYYGSDAAGGWQALSRPLRTTTTRDRFALVVPNEEGRKMRMLQPPELAAAMGFPDDYLWPTITRREHIKLIGNAVSPPKMQAVVDSLLR